MLWLAMGLARGVLADASPTPGAYKEDGDVLVRARLAVNLAAGVAVGVPAGLGWKGSLPKKPPMGRSNCPPPHVLARPWLAVGLANRVLNPARPCLFVGLATGVLKPAMPAVLCVFVGLAAGVLNLGFGSRCEASPTAAELKAFGLTGAVAASTGHGWASKAMAGAG